MQVPLVYKEKPLFGFDMGNRTVKVVQMSHKGGRPRLIGYGQASFPASIVVEGIISDPEELAKHIKPLLGGKVEGRIDARRVAAALPMGKIFTRTLKLPDMDQDDLEQAVHFEAEQYIPVPIADLYLDFQVTGRSQDPKTKQEQLDIILVATPRAIVDSYIKLFDILGLEVDSIETSLDAVTRALRLSQPVKGPVLVVDFGSRSTDIAIYNQALAASSSIAIGGDDLTESLVKNLGIKPSEATEIKFKFGLTKGDLQTKIKGAVKEQLQSIVSEIKKVQKFQDDPSKKSAITTMLLCGGSASLPGLSDYFIKELGIEVRIVNPWSGLQLSGVKAATKRDYATYTTAIGLACRGGAHD